MFNKIEMKYGEQNPAVSIIQARSRISNDRGTRQATNHRAKWLTSKFEHPGLDPEAELKGPWPCICSRPWVWRDCWETAMVGRWFLLSSHWAPQGDQQLHHWALLGPLGHIGTSAQLLSSKTCWSYTIDAFGLFHLISHSNYRHCCSPQRKGPW